MWLLFSLLTGTCLWVFSIYDNQVEKCRKQIKGWKVKNINGSPQGTVQRVRAWQQILATGLCLFLAKSHLGWLSCKAPVGECVVATVLLLIVWKATLPMAMDSSCRTLGILARNRSPTAVVNDWERAFIFRKTKWQPSSWQLLCVITLWARNGVELHCINYLPAEISSSIVSLLLLVFSSPQSL